MSSFEFNKLAGAILSAGLVFMLISVGVDELLHKKPLDRPVFPVPGMAATEAAEATAAAPTLSLAELLTAADVDAGKKQAKKCGACHSMTEGGPNKVGPNLWNIVNAGIGKHEGYSYSAALGDMGGDWGYDQLDGFLTKPKEFAPGTKMSFAGVKDPAARADLIAYLRSLSNNPAPLPAE